MTCDSDLGIMCHFCWFNFLKIFWDEFRFHSLEEFDEGKRSCRKRLDGHNRRRRKPQPDTSRAATLFSTHQGPFEFFFINLEVVK